MLCYKDMTFCISKNCQNKCGRKLTEDIKQKADEWWGKGKNKAPICQFVGKPDCYSNSIDCKEEA